MRILFLLLATCLAGCTPAALPREFGEVARVVAASMTDQAVWQTLSANIDGQVIEPGIEVRAGVLYIAQARLVGMSGQVGLRGSGVGTGTGPTDEARAAILRALTRSYTDGGDAEFKRAVLEAIRSDATPNP